MASFNLQRVQKFIKKYRYFCVKSVKDFINRIVSSLLSFACVSLVFIFAKKNFCKALLEHRCFRVYPKKIFKKEFVVIDLGAGHGELTKYLAKNSNVFVISFEKKSRFYRMTKKRVQHLDNVLVLKHDAYNCILKMFPKNSIDSIFIMFPDPWYKTKHQKRRPIRCSWLSKVIERLKINGSILIATDHMEYLDFIQSQINACPTLLKKVMIKQGEYKPEYFGLIPTYYYKKATKNKLVKSYKVFNNLGNNKNSKKDNSKKGKTNKENGLNAKKGRDIKGDIDGKVLSNTISLNDQNSKKILANKSIWGKPYYIRIIRLV